MGEIADMMLDGTMDWETGEWNFDGEDGPGFPMTGREAAQWRRDFGPARSPIATIDDPAFRVPKKLRKKIERFGVLTNHSAYHWQVRRNGMVVADWWPHRRKFRMKDKTIVGDEHAFLKALEASK